MKEPEPISVDEPAARPAPKVVVPAGTGTAGAAAAAVPVSLSSREPSAMTDAAPTRCPTEDTVTDAVASVLLGAGERSKERRRVLNEGKAMAAVPNGGGNETSEHSTSPPSLYALCELASELQRVLKGVQHVQRQILEAQKNIAWAIGEPSESLVPDQQQQDASFPQSAGRAAAATAIQLSPPSLPQQQRDVCSPVSAPTTLTGGDSPGSSLLSLMDLLNKQASDSSDLSVGLSPEAPTATQSCNLLKQLSACDSSQWSLEGSSSVEGPSAPLSTEGATNSKRGPWRSASVIEQQQHEAETAALNRMQSEEGAVSGFSRKRTKTGSSNIVDPAPMPGVRFAKDRNSWVAFWCENGKQNYKSFSNKKFGPEMARLMAIAARQSFDDRINRNGGAYSGGPHRSTDPSEAATTEVLNGVSGGALNGLPVLSGSSARSSNAPCDAQQRCEGVEEQHLSRSEMQQLAASLGNPKGVCYAPSNNTWMAYGSMGSGARMCRSFPVSKFGFYGARRLAIKAVSQYQQKQQQQQHQQQSQAKSESAAGRNGTGGCDAHSAAASATTPAQSLSPSSRSLDYTSALQFVRASSENPSPDSCVRRRRLPPKELSLSHASPSKTLGEVDLRALQDTEFAAKAESGAAYEEELAMGAADGTSALLQCSKATGEEGALTGSDLSAASALLLPLVASGHLMKFPEEESLLRSASELACLGLKGTKPLQ